MLLLLVALQGCGRKGPLFLPSPAAHNDPSVQSVQSVQSERA
ncbi:MAG: lipoprotein [Sideroxydans sp.]